MRRHVRIMGEERGPGDSLAAETIADKDRLDPRRQPQQVH